MTRDEFTKKYNDGGSYVVVFQHNYASYKDFRYFDGSTYEALLGSCLKILRDIRDLDVCGFLKVEVLKGRAPKNDFYSIEEINHVLRDRESMRRHAIEEFQKYESKVEEHATRMCKALQVETHLKNNDGLNAAVFLCNNHSYSYCPDRVWIHKLEDVD